MKNKAITGAVSCVAWAVIIYMVVSFINFDANPRAWGEDARFLAAIAWVGLSPFAVFIGFCINEEA